jgi:hypothetical protein
MKRKKTKKIKRPYFGFVIVNNLSDGKVTANWTVDAEQGLKLACSIAKASDQTRKFTLKVAKKSRKDGRLTLTVTCARSELANPQAYVQGEEECDPVDMLLVVAKQLFDGDWEALKDYIDEIKDNFPTEERDKWLTGKVGEESL